MRKLRFIALLCLALLVPYACDKDSVELVEPPVEEPEEPDPQQPEDPEDPDDPEEPEEPKPEDPPVDTTPLKLTGTLIGTARFVDYNTGQATTTVNTGANAFDGNFDTFVNKVFGQRIVNKVVVVRGKE